MLLPLRSAALAVVILIGTAMPPAALRAQPRPAPRVTADSVAGPERAGEPEDARAAWRLFFSAVGAISIITLSIEMLKRNARVRRGPQNRA